MSEKYILLGFDLEEFDMPFEYNSPIAFDEQLRYSDEGMDNIMPILEDQNVVATFFTTANYALQRKSLIKLIAQKHEIASHTFFHTAFKLEDLLESKLALEQITGKSVYGLRMPRMRPVPVEAILKAGYYYDSSVNPTWLPGRYNNFDKPRTLYKDHGLLRFPTSVSPLVRIPLFWLSFKNFPFTFYKYLAIQALKKDGALCLYFHPWEFANLEQSGIPKYTRKIDGKIFANRLNNLIIALKKEGSFIKTVDYIQSSEKNLNLQ